MGIGGHITTGVDTLLLLHLEGRQVDWQSRLFHLTLPIRAAYCSPDPRYYVTRRNGGHSVLHQSELVQAPRIRGKVTCLSSFIDSCNRLATEPPY